MKNKKGFVKIIIFVLFVLGVACKDGGSCEASCSLKYIEQSAIDTCISRCK